MSYRGRDRTQEEMREGDRWLSYGVRRGLLILAIVLGVAAIIWAISVAVSGPKGQGDAEKIRNDARNRVQVQQQFNQLYNSIKAQDTTIGIAYEELQADPKDTVKEINYSSLKRNCISTVAEYDTLAVTYTAKEWRDPGLPDKIDVTQPEFDCKENTK